MKYGVLEFTALNKRTDAISINLGDTIQSFAIEELYKQMNIAEEEIIKINFNDINNYDGEYVILPLNINLSSNGVCDIFPLPERIIPVFIGLSYFSTGNFSEELYRYFKQYEPIGCRDEFTLKFFRENNIQAYLAGCITTILPKRNNLVKDGKVFLIDIPDMLREYIPKHILDKSEELSHLEYNEKMINEDEVRKFVKNRIRRYRDEAELIVTARLHCSSPCMAMGIPIILAPENCSPRMSWIDKFLPIYTPDKYKMIDWAPSIVNLESYKKKVVNIASKRIREVYDKYSSIYKLSEFLENREKGTYNNLYLERLKKLPKECGDDFEYIIWGTSQLGIHAYNEIRKIFPKSKMVAAVDTFCSGTFFDKVIEKPNVIKLHKNAYIFIASFSGEKYIKNELAKLGKKEYKNYLSFASYTG